MKQKIKWMVALLGASAAVALADVALDFNVGTGTEFGGALTLNFTVNGSGTVTLDASTGSANADVVNTVNGWDGVVGTVANAALYNTSFSLTATAFNTTAARNITMAENDSGVLAVNGQSSGRIDGNNLTTPNPERLVWTLSAGSGVAMNFKSFSWGNSMANNSDGLVVKDADTSTIYELGTTSAGTQDISAAGYSIGNGGSLIFTAEGSGKTNGAGLAGFTFEVIPVPTTLGMVIACGSGTCCPSAASSRPERRTSAAFFQARLAGDKV